MKTLKAKRIRAQDSLIVKGGNQNKKQNEKQRKKGMEAEIRKRAEKKNGIS